MTPLRAVALLFTNIALVQAQKTGLTSSGGTDALSIQDGLPRSSTSELSLFASVSETCALFPGTDHLAQDVWQVKLTPTKGRGVFARRDIPEGTHILAEAPLFSVEPPVFVPGRGFAMAAMMADVERAYARLSPDEQQAYLSCHEERVPGDDDEQQQQQEETSSGHERGSSNNSSSWRLMAIFRSNAYKMHDGQVGIYPKVALINHSCQPNVLNADREGTRVIVATRDIRRGEEVLTTYIPLLMDTASRNQRLRQYGFQCNCKACQTRASDTERVLAGGTLRELEEQQGQSVVMTSGHTHHSIENEQQIQQQHFFSQAEALANYVEDQGFADYLVKTSWLASRYAAQAHNVTGARRWAEKHLRHHEVVGRDSEESRLARQLLESMSL